MTDKEIKFLEAAFEKTFDYDPDDDEVDAKYSNNFKKWEEDFINNNK